MSNADLALSFRGANLGYKDSDSLVLSGLDLSVSRGNWTCILGRSGGGKTTLLRYLAGLLDNKVTFSGELHLDNELSSGRLSDSIAYMAQQDLLYPWLSVLDNVCLAARFESKIDHQAYRARANELLQQVGLEQVKDSLPQTLSGGMRQRVALARTLIQDKPLVLMDEPFSALDAVNRHKLQTLACQLLVDKTVVLITHDPQEAVRLASSLYVLQGHPAQARKLTVPVTAVPRDLDAECATLQQSIIEELEADHV